MCLGVPGRVARIHDATPDLPMATVDFAGVTKEVCLACLPDAQVGDWVIVHVGFAISRLDEAEAQEVFRTLRAMGEVPDETSPES
jgi:hydrogenase expression/formation protein HypC